MSFIEPTKYEDLKDTYKVEFKNKSLFSYLLNYNVSNFNYKNKLFHELSKYELIEQYKELTKKHLELLESL